MKQNIQEIISEALKRAIRRDANLNNVEASDLLWAIESTSSKMQGGEKNTS